MTKKKAERQYPAFDAVRRSLPSSPGVYKFKNEEGTIIYVGKAKDLKKRVSSYFSSSKQDTYKVQLLVKHIHSIDFTVVGSEADAFLLENSLIKEYQPKYNIQLKDDKSYPFICIKNERFPRVFLTRKLIRDGSEYLGPYTSVVKAKNVLSIVTSLFPLRNCNYNLSEANISKGKFKVCLEYHLGNCLGPCEDLQTEDDYNESIAHIRSILRGNFSKVNAYLKEQIRSTAENLEFEKANELKEKMDLLQHYQSRSTVVNPRIDNIDVFTIVDEEKKAWVNYLNIAKGNVIQVYSVQLSKKLKESAAETLQMAMIDLRQKFSSTASEIITAIPVEYPDPEVTLNVPSRGDKLKLLELSHNNVLVYRDKVLKEATRATPQERSVRKLEILRSDFRLKDLPVHIECFDNSNFQGSNPVASVVVFKDAKPSKKDYRHFNIKTVEGPNDFASMEEVVYRRYKRLQEEKTPLPQLVLIDGGKGQLSSAMAAIERLGLRGKITVASIAKKLEEIYLPGDPLPLYLDKKSESLKLLQNLRNEAHRFAITFHRQKRSKESIATELTSIPGVGEKTAVDLLKKFGSLKKIKKASSEELASIVGQKKADTILGYLKD